MKNLLNITLTGLALAFGSPIALAGTSSAEALISFPSAQLEWQDVPGTGGAVSYANTEGDILSDGKGFYSAFVTFKAGTDNGLHSHSQTLPTVVLAGTFYANIDGKRTEFPAGSFYKLPANLAHESGCTSKDDCLLFQYQESNFDLVPVKR